MHRIYRSWEFGRRSSLFPRAANLDSLGNFIKETAIESETAVEEDKSTPPERYV
jgi:hypothetical protein